jgi:hypothetical protein
LTIFVLAPDDWALQNVTNATVDRTIAEGRGKKEEGSSATDSVTDVTPGRKREEGRRPFDGAQGTKREDFPNSL